MAVKRPGLALLVCLAAAACNPGTPVVADGLVLLRWGHVDARPLGLTVGRLAFEGGCVGVEGIAGETVVVLWPPDTQFDASAGALRVVINGIAFAEGQELRLGGGEATDETWIRSLVGSLPQACQSDRYILATELVVG
ncbi:MAG: hypothetical protein ACR2H0_04235 [Candidatus Limnocylindrales bacterium]